MTTRATPTRIFQSSAAGRSTFVVPIVINGLPIHMLGVGLPERSRREGCVAVKARRPVGGLGDRPVIIGRFIGGAPSAR